jgi:hypothetical protein
VQVNRTQSTASVVGVSGTLTHNTGNTTVTDGTYNMVDANGFDANGDLTDGTTTINGGNNTNPYEYVTPFNHQYTIQGNTFIVLGVMGAQTGASDVPTTGSATYNGGLQATYAPRSGTGGVNLSGDSTVSVDFAAGSVDVQLDNFTALTIGTGQSATAPADSIRINGMQISGNGFSGGTFSAQSNGQNANILGTGVTTNAQGTFFGYNATDLAPDEVGGSFLSNGSTAGISGIFIAD